MADRIAGRELASWENMPSASRLAAMTPPTLKRWMTPLPHSIGKEQPLAVARRIMKEHGLRHLPVLEGAKLVGVLSDRDLYFLESVSGVDPETEPVEQGMSQDVYHVAPDTPLREVIAEMEKRRLGCAIVVDRASVVGIFTTTDALRLVGHLLDGGS